MFIQNQSSSANVGKASPKNRRKDRDATVQTNTFESPPLSQIIDQDSSPPPIKEIGRMEKFKNDQTTQEHDELGEQDIRRFELMIPRLRKGSAKSSESNQDASKFRLDPKPTR